MVRKLLMMFGVVAACSPLLLPVMGMAHASTPSALPGQAAAVTCPNPCTVKAEDNIFDPKVVTVTAGTVITFQNVGQAAHTATSDSGAPFSFDSSSISPGASYPVTIPSGPAMLITYHCTYHQSLGMVGTIVVLGPGNVGPPSPTASPTVAATSDNLPSPSALPTPVPSQKYFPKIGGGLLVILLVGIAFGYLKTKRKLQDKG
ncbi:MAG: cupredoxin domain-containing protein [Actinomycetota bacterium]